MQTMITRAAVQVFLNTYVETPLTSFEMAPRLGFAIGGLSRVLQQRMVPSLEAHPRSHDHPAQQTLN